MSEDIVKQRIEASHIWLQDRVTAIRLLSQQYVAQLLEGCGSTDCRNPACFTGRSKSTSAPQRKPTARSARAIALCLAYQHSTNPKLCRRPRPADALATPDQPDEPKDFHNLLQHIADTSIVRAFTGSGPATTLAVDHDMVMLLRTASEHMSALSKLKNPPFTRNGLRNPEFVEDAVAIEIITTTIEVISDSEALFDLDSLNFLRAQDPLELMKCIKSMQHHAAADLVWRPDPADRFEETTGVYLLAHYMYHHPFVTLAATMFEMIARRTLLDDVLEKAASGELPQRGFLRKIKGAVEVTMFARDFPRFAWSLLNCFLMTTWTTQWDGQPVLRRGTAACGAMELACAIRCVELPTQWLNLPLVFTPDKGGLAFENVIQTYMAHENTSDTQSYHLLSRLKCLNEEALPTLFRTMNFISMRQARANNTAASSLFKEMIGEDSSDDGLQQYYLILLVSRGNIIQDTFDQLWDLAPYKLRRPLRVLLGESDGVAMGQDLGGVQVEFFNIVFRHLMSEEAGMFTTITQSGMSYFRPGSLQQLRMFEYVGMLVGLAMYNGISIPVSFPLAMYIQLLGEDCTTPAHISDCWIAESNSLGRLFHKASTVEDMALDYSFTFEANGLIVTMSRPANSVARHSLLNPMPLVYGLPMNSTAILHQPLVDNTDFDIRDDLEQQTLQWPGLKVIVGTAEQAGAVTDANRDAFVQDYIQCLTKFAVKPQLDAFRTGFYKVLEPYHIQYLSPGSMRSILEGTTVLDLDEMRSHTVYDGYHEQDPYIEHFWMLMSSWSEERRRALIRFVTAVERLPVGGAGMLNFKIQRANSDPHSPRLPTSSTCFGTLFLPKYESTAMMEKMLTIALDLGEYGFGVS